MAETDTDVRTESQHGWSPTEAPKNCPKLLGRRRVMNHALWSLSLAYYLVLESDSSMYRFSRWAHDHSHPPGCELPSQRINDIVRQIPEHAKLDFFRHRSSGIVDGEYLEYYTTSVSSYSETIKAARYGKNNDGDNLPQVNIALLIGERSALPVYYRIMQGNIADVSTINKLITAIAFIDIQKLCIVMDRGFFSTANIDALFATPQSFVIGAKASTAFVKHYVDMAQKSDKDFRNLNDEHGVFWFTYTAEWPDKGNQCSGSGRNIKKLYVHVYFDGVRAEDEKIKFMRSIKKTARIIATGERLNPAQEAIRKKIPYLLVQNRV